MQSWIRNNIAGVLMLPSHLHHTCTPAPWILGLGAKEVSPLCLGKRKSLPATLEKLGIPRVARNSTGIQKDVLLGFADE